MPALSIILAKPPVVNGAPRSLVKTKGERGSCSRANFLRPQLISPDRMRTWRPAHRKGCLIKIDLIPP